MNIPNTEDAFNNRFKQRLKAKETQIGLWSSLPNNIVTEILSYAGFDWILIDTEHAPSDITTLVSQLQAMKGSDTVPLVRPVWNDPIAIKRLLDIGFHNFIVPFVQNVEEFSIVGGGQGDNLQPRITMAFNIAKDSAGTGLPAINVQTTVSQRNLDVTY